MSPSQKASIIEGIQQNIDIGKYNIKAENMISNSLVSSNRGLLYADDEGKIISLDKALLWYIKNIIKNITLFKIELLFFCKLLKKVNFFFSKSIFFFFDLVI